MVRLHIATVGIGNDVPHTITYVTDRVRPDAVLLLTSTHTRRIAEDLQDQLERHKIHVTIAACAETRDVNTIAECYRRNIQQMMQELKVQPQDVTVDFTRGTKSMSAALVHVAIELGLGEMMYVDSREHDPETGRAVRGKEILVMFQPGDLVFRRDLGVLIRYFNTYRFVQALELIEERRHAYPNPGMQKALTFFEEMCRAYAAWDSFRIPEAAHLFRQLDRRMSGWAKLDALAKRIHKVAAVLETMNSDPWHNNWLLTLYAASLRRCEEGKFDVAVALLYRLMEFIAHRRLHELGFDPGCISLRELPQILQERWARFAEDDILRLGMRRSYELLRDLEDPLGEAFLTEYLNPDSALRQGLDQRNASVLAHGLSPIPRHVYNNLAAWVENQLKKQIGRRFRRDLDVHRFPKFDEGLIDCLL